VLLSLSQYQLQAGNHNGVLDSCDLGAEFSASYMQGRLNPAFEHHRALALHGLGIREECHLHLRHAYVGYALLGEKKSAENVQTESEEKFGIHLNLHGMDVLEWKALSKTIYNRGKHVDGSHLGEMIFNLRKTNKISMKTLSYGICSESALSNIENIEINKENPKNHDFYLLESIMQRLGSNVQLYHNFFLTKEDFFAVELRNKINRLLTQKRTKEAIASLAELETITHFFTPSANKEYRMNRQFVDMAKVCLFADINGQNHPNLSSKIIVAGRTAVATIMPIKIANILATNFIFMQHMLPSLIERS